MTSPAEKQVRARYPDAVCRAAGRNAHEYVVYPSADRKSAHIATGATAEIAWINAAHELRERDAKARGHGG